MQSFQEADHIGRQGAHAVVWDAMVRNILISEKPFLKPKSKKVPVLMSHFHSVGLGEVYTGIGSLKWKMQAEEAEYDLLADAMLTCCRF